jgi:hypothetical protein
LVVVLFIVFSRIIRDMALLGANYLRSLGCELGAEKDDNDFDGSKGSWLDFLALESNDFNEHDQVDDRLGSTRAATHDIRRQLHQTQLSVSQYLPAYYCNT